MADQCIICLEDLDKNSAETSPNLSDFTESAQLPLGGNLGSAEQRQLIAVIRTCGHTLHNACIQSWVEKANSCPICRRTFNLVEVYDKVGGILCSSYAVEDKKQVADFDLTALTDDQFDDGEAQACPICDSADNENVLLLCDNCDAPYHTYCVGLDHVPRGNWFCMECDGRRPESRSEGPLRARRELQRDRRQPWGIAQRTLAQVRRHRARTDTWHGAWNQISGRVYDALDLDLDYDNYADDDDDESLEGELLRGYRTHQQRSAREREEFERWQHRLRIAGHQGAREIFRHATRPIREQPQPQRQSSEEVKAWDTFEKVRESFEVPTEPGLNSSATGKRKARSEARSSAEPEPERERKLKRPRTRRVIDNASSPVNGNASIRHNNNTQMFMTSQRQTGAVGDAPPSFLSSLLKEVTSTTTDDRSSHLPQTRGCSTSHSPPVMSPSSSRYSTPRAMSATPPPPRQPQTRKRPPQPSPSKAISPTRANLSLEAKDRISKIVRKALDPHYRKPSGITKEQYGSINREVSRMLYDRIPDLTNMDKETRSAWDKIARAEVAKAVEGLKASI